MLAVLQGFSVILGIIGAGYLASRLGVVKGDRRHVLNDVSFFVATPALLFDVLQGSDPAIVISPVIIVTTITAVAAAAIYVAVSRLWFKRDLASTTLGAASSGYVNANNLGLPVAIYILGDAMFVAPLILVQVIIFAPIVLTLLESTRGNRGGAWVALARAGKNPIIIASVLGLLFALFRIETPEFVMAPIEMLGAASIPMILLSFGASLHGERTLQPGTDRVTALSASIIKLIIMPVGTWLLCLAFGLGAHETFAATTIAALPTAQNMYNYAATYRRAEIQVRDTVLITTFGSLPVIAVVAWLLSA